MLRPQGQWVEAIRHGIIGPNSHCRPYKLGTEVEAEVIKSANDVGRLGPEGCFCTSANLGPNLGSVGRKVYPTRFSSFIFGSSRQEALV